MKKICFAFLIISALVHHRIYSQTPQDHPKKYYVNAKGKVFWNAHLPFYLFGASDSLGSDIVKITTNNAEKYANPLYFDTEGDNFFRARWAVDPVTKKKIMPELEMMYVVYRDSYAPLTSARFIGANKHTKEGTIYYGKNLKIKLGATDGNGSGVENIFYSVNLKNYETYSDLLDFSQENEYDLKIYAVDNTGNAEKPKSFTYTVDTTAPTSRYSVYNDFVGDVLSPRSNIKLNASDKLSGVAGIYYRVDGKAAQLYTQALNFAALSEGEHTLVYFAKDNVGNKEAQSSYTFFLDKSAPKVTSNVVGEQYQNRGRVYVSERTKIELVAEDNRAGVEEISYQIDGGPLKNYIEPFSLPKGAGTHTIVYYAKDRVGNHTKGEIKQDILNKRSLDMDMVPPVINYNYTGKKHVTRDTVFITKNTKIVLIATDPVSGVKNVGYKVNGGEGKVYSKPFSIDEDGFYEIDFFATDQVNNRNTAKFYFEVDNEAPKITYVLSSESIGSIQLKNYDEPLEVYPKGINLYLAAQDNRVDVQKITYKIDNQPEMPYTAPIPLLKPGVVKFKIRAFDKLGNESEEEKTIYINN